MKLIDQEFKNIITFKGNIEIDNQNLSINYTDGGFRCTLYSTKYEEEFQKELLNFCIAITNGEKAYKFGE